MKIRNRCYPKVTSKVNKEEVPGDLFHHNFTKKKMWPCLQDVKYKLCSVPKVCPSSYEPYFRWVSTMKEAISGRK